MLEGCPFCHHSNKTLYREKQKLAGGGFRDIYRCSECGILYPEIRMNPEEASAYLARTHSNEDGFKFDNPTGPYDREDPLVKLAGEIEDRGSALDIGCFDGRFTHIMESLGFDAYGLEPQQKAVELAQSHGLKVFQGSFPENIPKHLLERKYGLILMNEIIYYLHDLKKSLSKAHEMLDKKGSLIIKCHQGYSQYYAYHSCFSRYGDYVQGIPTYDALIYCLTNTGFQPVKYLAVTESYYYEKYKYTGTNVETSDRLIVLSQMV